MDPQKICHGQPSHHSSGGEGQDVNIEHMCALVIHPVTGECISSYKKLARDPLLRDTWTTALGKEFGNLAQGDAKTGEEGTNCVFVMTHDEIMKIRKRAI